MKIDNKEIKVLKNEIIPIIRDFKDITIKSGEDMKLATRALSVLNRYADMLKKRKEAITKPLNTALKEVREMFKPLETELESEIAVIRTKLSDYQTNALKAQQKAEEKIAEKVTSGKLTLEKATKNLQALITPDEKVTTGEGSIRFRTTYSVKIVDVEKIPRTYLVPNEKVILEGLKLGLKIDGVELVETQTPINMR